MLADFAAMLLVQQLYRKFFKKRTATPEYSVFDRLDLEWARSSPHCANNKAIARFKINAPVSSCGPRRSRARPLCAPARQSCGKVVLTEVYQ